MKKALNILYVLLIFIQGGLCMNAHSNDEVVILGTTAKYINIAVSEFEKKLDVMWKNYQVMINDTGDVITVSFSSNKSTQGFRGAAEGVPGFEVSIDKMNLQVIDAHFVR